MRSPFVAGMTISLADPGGPIEAAKETMATLKVATSAGPILGPVLTVTGVNHHHSSAEDAWRGSREWRTADQDRHL